MTISFCVFLQYAQLFSDMAAIELKKYDEIECILRGLNLLLATVPDEVFTFEVRSVFIKIAVLCPLQHLDAGYGS